MLLLALGQPQEVIDLLAGIHTDRQRETVAAYRAVALFRIGRTADAVSILDVAEREYGKTWALIAAREHILGKAPFAALVSVATEDDLLPRIRAALLALPHLDPIRQVSAFSPDAASLESFLTGHIRAAGSSVVALVSTMKSTQLDSCEDDVTVLIREILGARLHVVGWSVSDQSKGGFTAKGGPGERDLEIKKDNTTLSIGEAVVCDRPITHQWTKGELTSHFQKLLAYGICQVYFHLTYLYVKNQSLIIDYLKQTAEKDVPAGFLFVDVIDLPLTDSRPPGFVASFKSDAGDLKVVFLVLDLLQEVHKNAAITAADSNPRNAKASSKAELGGQSC